MKATSHARFGVHAAPAVAFPVRLTGRAGLLAPHQRRRASMPHWNGVTSQPHGQVLSASEWSVSTTAADCLVRRIAARWQAAGSCRSWHSAHGRSWQRW